MVKHLRVGPTARVWVTGLLLVSAAAGATAPPPLRLATTTSTENSGLLAALLPEFTKSTGITVHVIAVGSGKAMKLGENGDVDLVLVHSRAAEDEFVRKGFGLERRDVMWNDFVLAGPGGDPAGVRTAGSASRALAAIARAGSPFVSRGDESGTHVKEKELWSAAGLKPSGAWYIEAGQSMEAVLTMADEKRAYTLADRGTLLALEGRLDLRVLCEGDTALRNPYGVIAVNPSRHPDVRHAEAMRFIEWITSAEGQRRIGAFRKGGKTLFHPQTPPQDSAG